jgi:cell division protease FtsH
VPTGTLDITLKDNEEKTLSVSDVVEIQELIAGYIIDPIVRDVTQENWFLTELLP